MPFPGTFAQRWLCINTSMSSKIDSQKKNGWLKPEIVCSHFDLPTCSCHIWTISGYYFTVFEKNFESAKRKAGHKHYSTITTLMNESILLCLPDFMDNEYSAERFKCYFLYSRPWWSSAVGKKAKKTTPDHFPLRTLNWLSTFDGQLVRPSDQS